MILRGCLWGCHAACLVQPSVCFIQRGSIDHVERMHMANSPCYIPPAWICICWKREGSPYTKVPLVFSVTYSLTESRVEYMSKILHNCQKDHLQIISEGRLITYMVTLQRIVVFTRLIGSRIHTCWCNVSTELVHVFFNSKDFQIENSYKRSNTHFAISGCNLTINLLIRNIKHTNNVASTSPLRPGLPMLYIYPRD